MKLLVHDYPGYAFPVELSRELARRGHQVHHRYADFTPLARGRVSRRNGDPESFDVEALVLGRPFSKFSFVRRLIQERHYGNVLAAALRELSPDVVLSGNAPPDAQARLLAASRQSGCRFVFWLQDLYGLAVERLLSRQSRLLGTLAGLRFRRLELRLLHASDAIVAITEDFVPLLREWGIAPARIHVIPNWSPVESLPQRPRDNSWARQHGLVGRPAVFYAGNLGLKHSPDVLFDMAQRLSQRSDAVLVVVSEGPRASWLGSIAASTPLGNIKLLPYQSFDALPDVLASADVLVAVLDGDAGDFCVPSKVLTYLCAGRPVVAAMPSTNLAARTLEECGGGLVVPPGDGAALVGAVGRLLGDPQERERMGRRARRHAETAFRIGPIADRFEELLDPLLRDGPLRQRP